MEAMTTKDYFTLSMSLLGLAVSIIALYLGQFRKPDFLVTLGPDVHLYHPNDGGTAVYLPIVFNNDSPTRGVIYQIYLRISAPNGQSYYLRWTKEASIEDQTYEYAFLGRVKPFTVDGYGSEAKVYWFIWPSDNEPLLFEPGEYKFTAFVWSKRNARPDIVISQLLAVNAEGARALANNRAKHDPHTRFFYFKDRGLIATRSNDADDHKVWKLEQTRP